MKEAIQHVETMREFFARDDVKRQQDIQKTHRYGSVEHRQAFEEIKRLAGTIGCAEYFGKY